MFTILSLLICLKLLIVYNKTPVIVYINTTNKIPQKIISEGFDDCLVTQISVDQLNKVINH